MTHRIRTAAILLLIAIVQPTTKFAQSLGAQKPQRVQSRTSARPPTPITLRQVLEALSSLRNSSRVEAQISRAGGVQFEASPAVVDILKQFGASAKLISMIPLPPPAPEPPAPTLA